MSRPLQTLQVYTPSRTRGALSSLGEWNEFIRNVTPNTILTEQNLLLLERYGYLFITTRLCHCHNPPNQLQLTRYDCADGWELRCPHSGTKTRLSIRHNSYFFKSELSIQQLLILVRGLALNESIENIAYQAHTTTKTVHHHWLKITDRMFKWLYENPYKHLPLFNENDIVEIDEMYKFHTFERGIGQFVDWSMMEGKWIFGAISRGPRSQQKLFITCVEGRKITSATTHISLNPNSASNNSSF